MKRKERGAAENEEMEAVPSSDLFLAERPERGGVGQQRAAKSCALLAERRASLRRAAAPVAPRSAPAAVRPKTD